MLIYLILYQALLKNGKTKLLNCIMCAINTYFHVISTKILQTGDLHPDFKDDKLRYKDENYLAHKFFHKDENKVYPVLTTKTMTF